MKIIAIVAIIFALWLIGEAIVIYVRAHRAKSSVLKSNGREIKYDKAYR